MNSSQFSSTGTSGAPSLVDVLDESLVGSYVIQGGVLTYVNDTFANMFGYETDEIIDEKKPTDLTAPKDRETVEERIRDRMEGREKSLRYSFSGLRKDGTTFEVEVRGTATQFNGEPAIIGTLRRADRSNRAEEVIEELAWGVANHTGRAFFRLLVVHLASCLNIELAYVGEYHEKNDVTDTLAFYRDGNLDDEYCYNLDHPSARQMLRSDTVEYDNGKIEFPNDDFFQKFDGEGFYGTTLIDSVGKIVGIAWVMSRSPFDDSELIRDVLQIFADRAGAEIERSRTASARDRSEAKYRNVFNSVQDGILILDPRTGDILEANEQCRNMFDVDPEELVGSNLSTWVAEESSFSSMRFFSRAEESRENGKRQFEWKFQSGEGQSFWGEVTVNIIELGNQPRLVMVVRDVNLRIQTEEAFTNPPPLDPVTDTASRSYFYQELETSLKYRPADRKTAVLFLDIDNYKQVNNTFGREIGDRVLDTLTQNMQSRLGDKGFISRWGGDEFSVLLPEVLDVPNAESIARELLDVFEDTITITREQFHLHASLGIAVHPEHAEEAGDLVSNAELAMFTAKDTTGNTYKVFSSESSQSIQNQFRLESDLRQALERNQFEVHYQPQFNLNTGRIAGVEALIRWRHPDQGFLHPKEFIPLAESRGLIEKIDEMVLREAVQVVQSLNEDYEHGLRLSVNFSSNHFSNPNLIEIVGPIIEESRLNSGQIVMEITETVAMKDVGVTGKLLSELKELGILVGLDDFGTGYASFSKLSRLPIDLLKVDRSLVSLMGSREEEFEVIKIIEPLARELDLELVAEGIETENQLELLRKWGCGEGQGFLFSKPLPNLNLQQMVESGITLDETLDRTFT